MTENTNTPNVNVDVFKLSGAINEVIVQHLLEQNPEMVREQIQANMLGDISTMNLAGLISYFKIYHKADMKYNLLKTLDDYIEYFDNLNKQQLEQQKAASAS